MQAFVPRVDTLKSVGGITLAVSLKSSVDINHDSWTDCHCDCKDQVVEQCRIYTRACTDLGIPNTRIAVIYTEQNGSTHVQYVNTDENGCFTDVLQIGAQAGTWTTTVLLDESDCREGARSGPTEVVVKPYEPDEPDECIEIRLKLIELTKLMWKYMHSGDDSSVKELYEKIQRLLEIAMECDPKIEQLIPLYERWLDAFFSGREDLLDKLFEAIMRHLEQ